MKALLKQRAIQLRNQGYSYALIASQISISKSTLSAWLKDVPYRPNAIVRDRIETGPQKSARVRHDKKIQSIKQVKYAAAREIGTISKRDLWMLGLGIYMGEGLKLYETIRVINANPAIIRLSIRWLKELCGLTTENFTVRVHLYPDNNIQTSLRYWSKELGIPLSQFKKTQIDTRAGKSTRKQKKLPHGTAHLTVVSNGNPEFGVVLHRRIMGWLEKALE